MQLIDDEGRLFGAVNVIDALVILLLLSVLIAGIAVVGLLESPEPETRYATIDLGDQPSYIVERIDVGDTVEFEGTADNLTITDVYRTTGSEEETSVMVRAELNGAREVIDEEQGRSAFSFAGERFRAGVTLSIETEEYEVEGQVIGFDMAGEDLPTDRIPLTVVSSVSASAADEISEGDTYTVDGTEIGTIESLVIYPGSGDQRTVLLGLELETIDRSGTPQFAGTDVKIGSSLPFATGAYNLSGEVIQRGTSDVSLHTESVTMRTIVPTGVATDVQPGDTFLVSGNEVAHIESVTAYPTSDPERTRLIVGVDLSVRTEGDRVLFGERMITTGATVPFRTGDYEFDGEIVNRGASEEPGTPQTTKVIVKLENVAPETAQSIQPGMTETVRGETHAQIQEVETSPADVVLESEDGDIYLHEHPKNKDVLLTVEMETRATDAGVRFHGERLYEGTEVTIDLDSVIVTGDVVDIQD